MLTTARGSGANERSAQPRDRPEVMVVVLGDKETKVDDRHPLLEARVKRGASEFRWAHLFEPLHELRASLAETGQNVVDRASVVTGLVRAAVLQVRGAESRSACVEIIEPLIPQRFEIEKMARVFLD